jgi:hypothetical protein
LNEKLRKEAQENAEKQIKKLVRMFEKKLRKSKMQREKQPILWYNFNCGCPSLNCEHPSIKMNTTWAKIREMKIFMIRVCFVCHGRSVVCKA